jgi:anti-sigma B factor antagonist
MDLLVTEEQTTYSIAINGDVDAVSAIKLDNALRDAIEKNHKQILIDCTNLHYISSPGIGVFTSQLDYCLEHGIKLVLYGMTEKVFNVFKILGLNEIIPIVDTKENAQKATQ